MIKIYKYRDKKKLYRWRIVARNGRILADCGQPYNSAQARDKGLELVLFDAADGKELNEAPPKKKETSITIIKRNAKKYTTVLTNLAKR